MYLCCTSCLSVCYDFLALCWRTQLTGCREGDGGWHTAMERSSSSRSFLLHATSGPLSFLFAMLGSKIRNIFCFHLYPCAIINSEKMLCFCWLVAVHLCFTIPSSCSSSTINMLCTFWTPKHDTGDMYMQQGIVNLYSLFTGMYLVQFLLEYVQLWSRVVVFSH